MHLRNDSDTKLQQTPSTYDLLAMVINTVFDQRAPIHIHTPFTSSASRQREPLVSTVGQDELPSADITFKAAKSQHPSCGCHFAGTGTRRGKHRDRVVHHHRYMLIHQLAKYFTHLFLRLVQQVIAPLLWARTFFLLSLQ